MYTIGTAALRYIRDHVDASLKPYFYTDAARTLEKIVAFVGTYADLLGDTAFLAGIGVQPAVPIPPTVISTYALFFVVPAQNEDPAGGRYHVIKEPITLANLWAPCYHSPSNVIDYYSTIPNEYRQVSTMGIQQSLLANVVRPIGGYLDALYKIQRGLLSDIGSAVRSDGLLYWSKDTKELYMWDQYYVTPTSNGWYPITIAVPVGTLWTWPTSILPNGQPDPIGGQPPAHWLRATGDWVSKTTYPYLWQAIGNQFLGDQAERAAQFRLPEQSNMIVRYE